MPGYLAKPPVVERERGDEAGEVAAGEREARLQLVGVLAAAVGKLGEEQAEQHVREGGDVAFEWVALAPGNAGCGPRGGEVLGERVFAVVSFEFVVGHGSSLRWVSVPFVRRRGADAKCDAHSGITSPSSPGVRRGWSRW